MSAPTSTTSVSPSTVITVKVTYDQHTRRFKLPLKDLGASTLPQNLRQLLGIPADTNVIFERYSDSAGAYIYLDSNNPAVFKQLYRAAKAKLKLRIRATVEQPPSQAPVTEISSEQQGPARYNYLATVLSSPVPAAQVENNSSATSSSITLPESPTRSTLTNTDKDIWTMEAAEQKSANSREFVMGSDNPNVPVLLHTSLAGVFCIDCNYCGRAIPNEHYHCNTCADGDYDLCPQCLDSGVACLGEGHWLVRRFVKDGIITNSTTKTLASHKLKAQEEKSKLLSSPQQSAASESATTASRVKFDEGKMVSCADCEDFDLCITCVLGHKHGHHPAHTFVLLGEHDSGLKNLVLSRCKPGRGYHHAAICDGCENHITGVRHKCLTCPDWDYCSECHLSASRTHPGHRFAPLYTAISEPLQSNEIHFGVFCDGPLCKDKSMGFITGVRYKCSVCHDTDFCAKCEVHTSNMHNRTHPMIMFKTPVRSVSVSTVHENAFNQSTTTLGDRTLRSTSTQASAPPAPEPEVTEAATKEEAEPVEEPKSSDPIIPDVEEQPVTPKHTSSGDIKAEYQAFFIEDTIADRTVMRPNQVFQQTWKLYNPGPRVWPSGTNVRFVGGDSMFNIDTNHPTSLASVTAAMESNKLCKPLEVGEQAEFTVTLKTPKRLGTAISYWRLKLDDGTPFGHKLWCDVQVRDDPVEDELVSEAEVDEKDPLVPTVEPSDEVSRSQMVFPKLEKESPASSTHEAASIPPTAPSVSNASEDDLLDDVASLSLDDADTEAGFLTDEEYDILDASDQEFMDAKKDLSNIMARPALSVVVILLAILASVLYNPVQRMLTVVGVYRNATLQLSARTIHAIPDTLQCEDVHYYAPGNVIFAACEDSVLQRFRWFPPLVMLDGPADSTGSIHVIDPQTLVSSRLEFENFPSPFITHGIDVIQDPDQAEAVYIFAVNHLANPEYRPNTDTPKARSQIEIFHHVLGASTTRHVRSVRHPLITTPNDIYAINPHSFYVTNDHYYREGLLRHLETLPGIKWSDVIHVQLDQLTTIDATAGINATVALPKLHACNGLGHGQTPEDVLVTSVTGGVFWRARANENNPRTLSILEETAVDSAIDNPSYYDDPYKTTDNDASGYILAGLRRAIDLPKTHRDPNATEGVIVWHVRNDGSTSVIFEDDGTNIRSASAAVLVPLEPTKGGPKEATLFVTGFLSNGMVSLKVQL
ncbi:hypothetical protein BJX63DRAFT_420048 [Aspergillus granulosus]|uniref:ZZ-type domain-containing protein n=1 Tax=Aspergillus granulosus TaxID=176169 RepID=A0ABR4HNN1_9EURO